MVDCYHNDVYFKDPAFGVLKNEHAGNMWRMLCKTQKGKEFRVKFFDIEADDQKGRARWEAHYDFSKTGRRVHNVIGAQFEFKDRKIIRYIDDFDLSRWSRQALGIKGYAIGWTSFFRKRLQTQTRSLLQRSEEK